MPFNEWHGEMSWPLDTDWECEICGNAPFPILDLGYLWTGLVWGIVHGVCRCTKCHAQYRMRDHDGERVTTPILRVKVEYRAAAKVGWRRRHKPLSEWSDDMWTMALKWAQEATEEGVEP